MLTRGIQLAADRNQLKDTPGNEEVVLTRKFGDESYVSTISTSFVLTVVIDSC